MKAPKQPLLDPCQMCIMHAAHKPTLSNSEDLHDSYWSWNLYMKKWEITAAKIKSSKRNTQCASQSFSSCVVMVCMMIELPGWWYIYQVRNCMALGRPRTPAPTIAVTLWKAAYHHLAFLLPVTGNQSSTVFPPGPGANPLSTSSTSCTAWSDHEN